MWNDFIYVKIDKEKSIVISSGIKFKDFTNALGKCKNYLLLAGESDYSVFSKKLLMEYIEESQVDAFLNEDVENWGDFCWIDFQQKEELSKVTEQELAELLYMRHRKRLFLEQYTVKALKNEYVYLCHDDEIYNYTYMRQIEDYKKVLEYVILKECADKKKECFLWINGIKNKEVCNKTVIEQLFMQAHEGIILDFQNLTSGRVDCYVCNGIINTLDELEKIIETHR